MELSYLCLTGIREERIYKNVVAKSRFLYRILDFFKKINPN